MKNFLEWLETNEPTVLHGFKNPSSSEVPTPIPLHRGSEPELLKKQFIKDHKIYMQADYIHNLMKNEIIPFFQDNKNEINIPNIKTDKAIDKLYEIMDNYSRINIYFIKPAIESIIKYKKTAI